MKEMLDTVYNKSAMVFITSTSLIVIGRVRNWWGAPGAPTTVFT